jgi:hypothetical protein
LDGAAKYTELPMLYSGGFVEIGVLDRIKQATGCYFNSSSPDVYSGVAIAQVVDRYAYSRTPLAISGSSKHSTGTSFYSKTSVKDDTPSQQFCSETNIPFHPELPLCADGSYPLSLHALAYEAYLQSKALRSGPAMLDRQRQLEIILTTSGRHRRTVLDWGQIFAKQHGLDFSLAARKARLGWPIAMASDISRKILNAVHTDSIGSDDTPIATIFEAGLAMTNIHESASMLSTLRAEIKRKLRY